MVAIPDLGPLLADTTDPWWIRAQELADDCFLCGRALSCLNLVLWQGPNQSLWLHAACAVDLGVALIADGRALVAPPSVETR